MPDLVALGNEANLGLFSNLDGSNYTPGGPTMSAAATAFQLAGLQQLPMLQRTLLTPLFLAAVAVPLRCVTLTGPPILTLSSKDRRVRTFPSMSVARATIPAGAAR